MKITDIAAFKTIAGNKEKQLKLVDLFIEKGFINLTHDCDGKNINLFLIHQTMGNDRLSLSNFQSLDTFDECNLQYIPFCGVIKLLESIEDYKKPPKGKFVEFDIDSNGQYMIPNTAILSWQDYMTYEQANKRIFGGWLWSHNGEEHWRGRVGLTNHDKLV
ncbi:hypothetical protein, partial [Methanoculleus sp.]|uniref:hypothetical protein n=1 Tax=Methanoculleus sp. TaxID=90427 RepID=UPI0025D3E6C7